MAAPLVVILSGPESSRARAEVALEDAGLPILPDGHHAHLGAILTPTVSGDEPDEPHGFVAVAARNVNGAAATVEPHGWALRMHYEMPDEPRREPDLAATLDEMRAEIDALKARVG